MALPTYDKSNWPIFGVKMPMAAMLEHEFVMHVDTLKELLRTERRFAILVDARGAHPLNAKQRASVAALHRQALERDPEVVVGIAVILASALERGVLTAINWAAGSRLPTQPFSTPEAGVAWLDAKLARFAKPRS